MARNTIKLTNIINNIIMTRDEDDYGKYMNELQMLTFGKECIRNELAQDLNAYPKSVKLVVNDTLDVVELPNDFIDYTKIGVLDDCGQVQVLGVNNKINYAGSYLLDNTGGALLDSDGVEILSEKEVSDCANTNNGIGAGFFFNNYYAGNTNGRLFGLGGGNNKRGYYRFNTMDNRIELSTEQDWSNGIILEYIADESMLSDPTIPIEAEAMVRDYIYFRMISNKTNVPQSAIQVAERRFRSSKRRGVFKRNMFTKAELAQTLNKRFQASPKFLFE